MIILKLNKDLKYPITEKRGCSFEEKFLLAD